MDEDKRLRPHANSQIETKLPIKMYFTRWAQEHLVSIVPRPQGPQCLWMLGFECVLPISLMDGVTFNRMPRTTGKKLRRVGFAKKNNNNNNKGDGDIREHWR